MPAPQRHGRSSCRCRCRSRRWLTYVTRPPFYRACACARPLREFTFKTRTLFKDTSFFERRRWRYFCCPTEQHSQQNSLGRLFRPISVANEDNRKICVVFNCDGTAVKHMFACGNCGHPSSMVVTDNVRGEKLANQEVRSARRGVD